MILNGKELSDKIKEKIKNDIQVNFLSKNLPAPKLAVILVGDDSSSKIYVANKEKSCEQVNIQSNLIHLENDTTEEELSKIILELNKDKSVNGILLQLPLPKHIDKNKIINLISPEKDVDGLTNINFGKLVTKDDDGLFGCTPSGIMELLKEYSISLSGKDVLIINRSLLVGKPLAHMMMNSDATVTIAHSKTKNIKEKTLKADIIIVGVGKEKFLSSDMIKDGCIVIDVGINRNANTNKICGDCDFEKIRTKASFITPVPGGIGPMTIAMLLTNTYKATIIQNKKH